MFWALLVVAACVGIVGFVADSSRLIAASIVVIAACAATAAMFSYQAVVAASRAVERSAAGGREVLRALQASSANSSERFDQLDNRIDQTLVVLAGHLDTAFAEAHRALVELQQHVDVADARSSERDDSIAAASRQLRRAVNASAEQLSERIPVSIDRSFEKALVASRIPEQLRALRHETVTEMDALLQLHRRFGSLEPTPLVWGWAMSPRGVLHLVDLVSESGHRQIVECGPGTSTVYMGRALQQVGSGRVTGLEHSPAHAEATRQLIRRLGLNDVVEIRLAELVDVPAPGGTARWYNPACLTDLADVDLVVVDGPPGKGGGLARRPALEQTIPILADQAIIVLDDTNRPDEQRIVTDWSSDPRLTLVDTSTPDQTVFRWRAGAGEVRVADGPQLS